LKERIKETGICIGYSKNEFWKFERYMKNGRLSNNYGLNC